MDDIAPPSVLNPERLTIDDRNEMTAEQHADLAEDLHRELGVTCEYATKLWQALDGMRAYLLESAPENPRTVTGEARSAASPTGPDDDAGWESWATAYASISSVLVGPLGNDSYGRQVAEQEERDRRLSNTATRDLPADDSTNELGPDGGTDGPPSDVPVSGAVPGAAGGARGRGAHRADDGSSDRSGDSSDDQASDQAGEQNAGAGAGAGPVREAVARQAAGGNPARAAAPIAAGALAGFLVGRLRGRGGQSD